MTLDIKKLWSMLSGYKTYIVGVCAIIYGVYIKSPEIIVTGLGLLGLRNAIATSLAQLLSK